MLKNLRDLPISRESAEWHLVCMDEQGRRRIMANASLQYVRAHDIGYGSSAFGAMVCDPDGQPIGRLEGFMIDPQSQTVRYFVVDNLRGRRLERRMIPFAPAQLDLEHHVVRLIDQPHAA
jgi:hypothetical protein